MLRHLWLSDPEHAHQIVHGALAAGERVEDLPPPGLRHRVERVCRGRRSCHGHHIYRLRWDSSTSQPRWGGMARSSSCESVQPPRRRGGARGRNLQDHRLRDGRDLVRRREPAFLLAVTPTQAARRKNKLKRNGVSLKEGGRGLGPLKSRGQDREARPPRGLEWPADGLDQEGWGDTLGRGSPPARDNLRSWRCRTACMSDQRQALDPLACGRLRRRPWCTGVNLQIPPADFHDRIDNPYWPMRQGSRWVYGETDSEGTRQRVVVTVTRRTKLIANGVRARVVHDVVTEKGVPVEVTDDYYAQDRGRERLVPRRGHHRVRERQAGLDRGLLRGRRRRRPGRGHHARGAARGPGATARSSTRATPRTRRGS